MAHTVLYRKYRPQVFQDITGQDFVIKTLRNSIKLNRLAHAYIFAGPKGIGKTTIAKVFAKAINCLSPVDGDACNKCEACKLISAGQTTDILELDAASNNSVDDIRNIIENVNFLPTILKKKVYIIDEAHMLTPSAWNAMLKTIEETPEHVVFIFATTEIHKIPATILSRCQHYQFNRLTNLQLSSMINDISNKEQIAIEPKAVDKIVELIDGSARDALSILEQMAMYTNNSISLIAINEVFGLLDDTKKIDLINLMIAKDTKSIMNMLDQYAQNGINFTQLANDIILMLIDKLVYLQTNDVTILKRLNSNNVNLFTLNVNEAIQMINNWQEAYMKIKSNADARFYFELAIFATFKIFNQANVTHAEGITPVAQSKMTPPVSKETIAAVEDEDKSIPLTATLPDLGEVFTVSEFKPSPKAIVNEQVTKAVEVSVESFDSVFNEIAYNYSVEFKNKADAFLMEVKQMSSPGILSFMIPANKVLIASQNGMVLMFDDAIDAELLNNKFKQCDFINALRKLFGRPIYVFGFNREKLMELSNHFKELKKLGKSFNEPNIAPLTEILKSNNSVEQAALEIFGK